MFAEPNRTPYDLTFRVFGFAVRVHPLFWVGAAILGSTWLNQPGGTIFLLIWIAAVFVSILVHEFGHAVLFRRFQSEAHIVLYMFGGLAVPWREPPARWQRILVSLAGPGAGFVLFAVIYFSNYFYPWAESHRYAEVAYRSLFFINLYWGLFNLLPVFPLDGGRVSQEVCSAVSRRNGLRIALEISIAVAGLVALYSLACELERRQGGGWLDGLPGWFPRGTYMTAILFGMLAVQNYQLLQQLRWTDAHWDDRSPWGR